MSLSQISSAASIVQNIIEEGPLCHCSRPTIKCISWSDENPGRRYFTCNVHGFVVWYDKNPGCLWQKQSLLEAREKMRRQTQELNALRDAVVQLNAEISALQLARSTRENNDFLNSISDMVKAQNDESEKKFRQFIVASWGGFFVTAAVIVYVLKN
ncbi:hypothetical protein N665_0123s0024 [Sinapis alba]|nr:hypothetical protein N665_0123s0024 [Sinapis alba]